MLYATGAVGRPGEWLWRGDVDRNWKAWGVSSWREYLDRVLEAGTAPNGVFCTKLMWGYLHDALFELRRLSRMYEEDDLAVLRSFFPEPSFVWIRREDVVAQAVSWAKAAQTGQWASFQPVQAEPVFDFDYIDGLYHLARVHDGGLGAVVRGTRCRPAPRRLRGAGRRSGRRRPGRARPAAARALTRGRPRRDGAGAADGRRQPRVGGALPAPRRAVTTSRGSRAALRARGRRRRGRASARRGRRRRARGSPRRGSASSPRRSPSRAGRDRTT